jgi:hypothetical protein
MLRNGDWGLGIGDWGLLLIILQNLNILNKIYKFL